MINTEPGGAGTMGDDSKCHFSVDLHPPPLMVDVKNCNLKTLNIIISRAGPKGLCAESAGAFTGRRYSHSGRGEDFLSSQPIFFTETAVTPEQKVKKWFPTWEINRHAEG